LFNSKEVKMFFGVGVVSFFFKLLNTKQMAF